MILCTANILVIHANQLYILGTHWGNVTLLGSTIGSFVTGCGSGRIWIEDLHLKLFHLRSPNLNLMMILTFIMITLVGKNLTTCLTFEGLAAFSFSCEFRTQEMPLTKFVHTTRQIKGHLNWPFFPSSTGALSHGPSYCVYISLGWTPAASYIPCKSETCLVFLLAPPSPSLPRANLTVPSPFRH